MKCNKVLLVFFFLIGTLMLNAQDQPKQDKGKVRLGLRGGVYFSRFKFTNQPPEFSKTKGDDYLYGGLQIDIPLSQKVSLTPEILYALSSSQSYDGLIAQLYHDEISQLLIPVLFRFKLGQVSLLAGPQAEFLLSATGNYGDNGFIVSGDIKENSYAKFTMAGVIGAEWVFKYRFGIDARYQFGLSNGRADNAASMMTEFCDKVTFNAFQAGIFFRFGKKPKN